MAPHIAFALPLELPHAPELAPEYPLILAPELQEPIQGKSKSQFRSQFKSQYMETKRANRSVYHCSSLHWVLSFPHSQLMLLTWKCQPTDGDGEDVEARCQLFSR